MKTTEETEEKESNSGQRRAAEDKVTGAEHDLARPREKPLTGSEPAGVCVHALPDGLSGAGSPGGRTRLPNCLPVPLGAGENLKLVMSETSLAEP